MILPPGINLLNYGWKEMPGVIIFCNLKVEEYIILISFIISSSTLGPASPTARLGPGEPDSGESLIKGWKETTVIG